MSAAAAGTDLIEFLKNSPSSFHTALECKRRLVAAGFAELDEKAAWELQKGQKYFFLRGNACYAFAVGGQYTPGAPFAIIGAHTDFPTLRVKPQSNVTKYGIIEVGVQPYGGGLWSTWFDRDLGLAGTVCQRTPEGALRLRPVVIRRPIARIPNLAIHLDREATRAYNPQQHILPVLASTLKAGAPHHTHAHPPQGASHHPILLDLLARECGCDKADILDFDLSFFDIQDPVLGGALGEFVFAQHLDNGVMTYTALEALIATSPSLATDPGVRMACFFDHEEVGSRSAEGAASDTLRLLIGRVARSLAGPAPVEGLLERTLRASYLVSADVAHAFHPNYAEKYEEKHACHIGAGPVIKFDFNQRYATNLMSSVILQEVARQSEQPIPLQKFIVRNDGPCGSTIGPALSANCTMTTIDLGIAILSMHSIREQCAVDDVTATVNLFREFYCRYPNVSAKVEVKNSTA